MTFTTWLCFNPTLSRFHSHTHFDHSLCIFACHFSSFTITSSSYFFFLWRMRLHLPSQIVNVDDDNNLSNQFSAITVNKWNHQLFTINHFWIRFFPLFSIKSKKKLIERTVVFLFSVDLTPYIHRIVEVFFGKWL